jgi:hypothetical protein
MKIDFTQGNFLKPIHLFVILYVTVHFFSSFLYAYSANNYAANNYAVNNYAVNNYSGGQYASGRNRRNQNSADFTNNMSFFHDSSWNDDDFTGNQGTGPFESIELNAQVLTFSFGRASGGKERDSQGAGKKESGKNENMNVLTNENITTGINDNMKTLDQTKNMLTDDFHAEYMSYYTKKALMDLKNTQKEYYSAVVNSAVNNEVNSAVNNEVNSAVNNSDLIDELSKKLQKKKELFLELLEIDKEINSHE